jgi:hypothetical protein
MVAAFIFALLLLPLLLTARAYRLQGLPNRYAISRQLELNLGTLDKALGTFKSQHGCYPGQLADLTRDQATSGLDASGNKVAVRGGGGKVLPELPVDPLTNRADTWVYDVLSAPMVDSGAYRITVTTENP